MRRRGDAGTATGDRGLIKQAVARANLTPAQTGLHHAGQTRGADVATIGETSAQLALRDPDIRLMLRVRDDEAGAFEELVERYQHRLVAVMHHLVGNAEEAEDLAQEVFLRVYRLARSTGRAPSSRPGCSPSPTTWP